MGIIQCPRCGEDIDNRAYVCAHCGYILNDDSNDKHEEWAIKLKNKYKIKRTIGVVFLLTGLFLGLAFFVLLMATSITRVSKDGSSLIEYNPIFGVFTALFLAMFGVGIVICFIYRWTNVMIQTFDGYTVAVKTALADTTIYVQNQIVLKKTKNYLSNTYLVSLPNNKKVNIVLGEEVTTFELINEE